jgi:beta-lactamase class A
MGMTEADDIQAMFASAECAGQLCVQSVDGAREVTVDADQPVVSASVFKVLVAIVVETAFAEGTLDPRERIILPGGNPVPGPVGFSLYTDDVQVSLRDLVVPMLTISDYAATDALLNRVGIDYVNKCAERLGLRNTVIPSDMRTMIDSIGQDAGFANWNAMLDWTAHSQGDTDEGRVVARIAGSRALMADLRFLTTARDMTALLRLIWADVAGPAAACDRVRQLMRQQVAKHRLASQFKAPAQVAAKSGSLVGIIHNEIGVIEYPDGDSYAVAVFTQANVPWHNESAINVVIGHSAATAVARLRQR